jgi:hypothetical protein
MPLRLARRPLVKHASPTHGVGLVSLPALGALRVRHRLLESLTDIVATLVSDDDEPGDTQRRLVELARNVDTDVVRGPVFLSRVVGGNIRLLLGMIRSNHPWRFATRLSRALSGAVAAGSFALVTSDVWRTGAQLATWRLAGVALAAVAVATLSLISLHNLWERNREPRVREQVTLFNVVTTITVAFGIATLYLALFALSLAGGALVIQPSVFKSVVGHSPDLADYVRLAWFTASLATVGGALGGALETDESVREAAYAYRGEEELVSAMNESDAHR